MGQHNDLSYYMPACLLRCVLIHGGSIRLGSLLDDCTAIVDAWCASFGLICPLGSANEYQSMLTSVAISANNVQSFAGTLGNKAAQALQTL